MNRLFAAGLLAILSTGCATSSSVRRLSAEVAALRTDVAALRQAQEQTSRDGATASADLRSFEARVSQLSASVTAATSEAGRLQARVEDIEETLKQPRTPVDSQAA